MSAVDEIIAVLEDSSTEKLSVENVCQKLSTFDEEEWRLVLLKVSSNFRLLSEQPDGQINEKLRMLSSVLACLDTSSVKFRERDELVDSIGKFLLEDAGCKWRKQLSDVILGWVKGDWLNPNPKLYNFLEFQLKTVQQNTKVGDVKNLSALSTLAAYAVKCSGNEKLISSLFTVAVNPNVFQHPDGRKLTVKLFEQSPERMHDGMKSVLSESDKKLGKPLGELYVKCVTSFSQESREIFLQNCIQDFAYWSLCMPDENLASTLMEAMIFVNKTLKVSFLDEVYELYSPFLLKNAEATNSTFRCRSAKLLFSVYPLTSSKLSEKEDETFRNEQINLFEKLLVDDVPAVRAASIMGLCELASTLAETLPVGWLQKTLSKVFNRLAFDISSPVVRLNCVKGLGRLVENHILWQLCEGLFRDVRFLLHDKSSDVRTAFAQLLNKIVKLHAFKPWKYLNSNSDFLPRLAADDDSVCIPLSSLLMELHLPAEKDAIFYLDKCVGLVEKNAFGARNFYKLAIANLGFGRAAEFVEKLLIHLNLKSDRVRSKIKDSDEDIDHTLQSAIAGKPHDVNTSSIDSENQVDMIIKLVDIAAACWLSLLPQLKQSHNSSTSRNLERLAAMALPRVFKICEHYGRDASNVVLFASCLPWRTVPVIFQKTVSFIRRPGIESTDSESSMNVSTQDDFSKTSSVAIKALTNWAKLSELLHIVHESVRDGIAALRKELMSEGKMDESKRRSTRKRVRFGKAKTQVKENPASIHGLETHLNLLDMLLRNRNCVRQLRGKEAQLREIWEELVTALDLIGFAAKNDEEVSEEQSRYLILCFEYYCRLGLIIHVDSSTTPVSVDDDFLRKLASWLRSNTGIFSGVETKSMSNFQVSLCCFYLKQLTTRLMLDSTLAADKNETIVTGSSAIAPSDIFEMALDATAFVPGDNRVAVAEKAMALIHASAAKLVTLNGRLTKHERSEHMRIVIDYLEALKSSQFSNSPSALSHATDCFVLLSLLTKKSEKTDGFDPVEEERIANGFTALTSIAINAMNDSEDDNTADYSHEKRRNFSRNPSSIFNIVFSRFYPYAVRSIFIPYLNIVDETIKEEQVRTFVAKWLSGIGYTGKELPEKFNRILESTEPTPA